jgi:hypothetical protein
MHLEIQSAAQALTEAERLLGSGRRAGQDGTPPPPSAGMWESYAVSPLAAILLATARANAGLADVATVLDVVLGPSSDPSGRSGSTWVTIAQRCPGPFLRTALLRAAALAPAQRDSMRLAVLDALAPS